MYPTATTTMYPTDTVTISGVRVALLVSLVGAVTMIVIFSFAIIMCIKKSNYHSEAKDEVGQAICCVSICFFMLHPTIGIWALFSHASCNAIYITAYLCYGFGKVSMYWLFIWKIKYILSRDMGSDFWFLFFVVLSGVIPTILMICWAIKVKFDNFADTSLNYCFPDTSLSLAMILSFSFHILFSIIILIFYIWKMRKIGNLTMILRKNQDQSRNKVVEEFGEFLQDEINNKKKDEIVAAFWVATVTLVTTAIMTLGMLSEYELYLYILSLDSVVNCICIFWLCFGWCPLCSDDYRTDSPLENNPLKKHDVEEYSSASAFEVKSSE